MAAAKQHRDGSGLRERKRARTRATIRRHALQLFARQGYHATTFEQIAAAAEVAPSTVYRYFPTKEALVDLDEHHSVRDAFLEALTEQLAEQGAVEAFRKALGAMLGAESDAERGARREREQLLLTVPEVWAANTHAIADLMRKVGDVFADWYGDSQHGHTTARVLCGAALAVWLDTTTDPEIDSAAELERTLARIEAPWTRT